MVQCHGITKKLTRCQVDAGEKWFCHIHVAQPKYLLALAISSILFSYLAGLLPVPWRINMNSAQLLPGDFSVSLQVSVYVPPLEYKAPQRISLFTRIGPVLLESKMDLETEAAREYPSMKNPNRYFRYSDKAPFVKDMPEITLRSLIGKELTAKIPVRAFKFDERPATLQLRVFVRGRELLAEANENGEILLLLTKDLLIGTGVGLRVYLLFLWKVDVAWKYKIGRAHV